MQVEELTIEGIHVTVRPEWTEKIHKELDRLEKHHPNALTRVRVRFRPIKQGRPGVTVLLDGQINQHGFDVERDHANAVAAIGEAFDVLERNLNERAHHSKAGPTIRKEVQADEEEEPTED